MVLLLPYGVCCWMAVANGEQAGSRRGQGHFAHSYGVLLRQWNWFETSIMIQFGYQLSIRLYSVTSS